MKRFAAPLVIAFLLLAAAAGAEPGASRLGSRLQPEGDVPYLPGRERDCFCPQNYDPVVCEGGTVFPNACVANCANAKNCAAPEPRPENPPPPEANQGCFCPEIYQPVVCKGGAIFSNPCFAACAKAENCRLERD